MRAGVSGLADESLPEPDWEAPSIEVAAIFTCIYRILMWPQNKVSHLRTVPITGIHLWFDREITPLEHAALLDRTIQWMFQKSRILTSKVERERIGSYLELVVSSSKGLLEMGRAEIIALALKELAEFFPGLARSQL